MIDNTINEKLNCEIEKGEKKLHLITEVAYFYLILILKALELPAG